MPAPAQATSQVFLNQAAACEGRSQLYAELLRQYADDPVAAAIVGPDPEWDAPLRLLGGLHFLVLGGRARWDDPLEQHRGFLSDFVATQGVQTNEVQRSWVLLPLLLRVAERTGAEAFDLVELGPSAGLNLVWDRYRYRYVAGEWGPEEGLLRLAGEERRSIPGELLERRPTVRGRVGIDRAPIDVTSEAGARLLRSFVWAGQDERMQRLDHAIEAVRADPPELVRGDYVERLPEVLAEQPRDGLTVVFQTASFGYIGDEGRARVRAVLEKAGEARGLAFISTGKPRAPHEHCWGLRLVHRLLDSRRQRERERLFVVEGEDLVESADDAGIEPVELFRAGEDVEPELLAKVSTMAHPPRVIGIYRREDLPRGVDPVSLALWHVADPGNLGTILRTADAFGASVALSAGCADPTGPKAVRASAGALFRVPLAAFDEPEGTRIALVSHGGRPLSELDPGVPVTYVLGAEREGLPDEIVAACDETATIPLAADAESLNVAVAGAIALYEHRR